MGLKGFSYGSVSIPKKSFLSSDIREKYRMTCFKHVYTICTCDQLHWWSRHSHHEVDELLLGSLAIVNKFHAILQEDDGWEGIYAKGLSYRCKSCAIDLSYTDIGIVERLGDVGPEKLCF